MPDITYALFAFVGFVVLYFGAVGIVKATDYLKAKPWVALLVIALLGAALLTSSSGAADRAEHTTINASVRRGRTFDQMDL